MGIKGKIWADVSAVQYSFCPEMYYADLSEEKTSARFDIWCRRDLQGHQRVSVHCSALQGCSHPGMQLRSGGGCLLRYGMSSVSLLQLCITFNPRTVPLVLGVVASGSYSRPGSGWMCVCARDDTPIHPPSHPRTRAWSPAREVDEEGLPFL